jgi:hypothetical protein
MAHASSAGRLLRIIDGEVQITDDSAATPILVYGTRYMLAVTEVWNAHFKLIEESKMIKLLQFVPQLRSSGSSGQTEDCPVISFFRLGAL